MRIAVLAFCLVIALPISAQEEFIRGRLLDAVTEEPIPFATVRVKGKYKGVISNEDGGFRIPQFFKQYGDTLQITCMGYREMRRAIDDFSPEHINILRLHPGVFELEEAVVRAKRKRTLSAKRIVRRAIGNIPENYPQNPFSTIGYYRDYQKDEKEYVNLNEALLEIFDSGFGAIDTATTKTRIYDYKRNTDFRRDSLADDPYNYKDWLKIIDNAFLQAYGGNEFAILRVHDPIRNYQVNSFDFINSMNEGDVLRNHSFKRLSDTYLEGERLYTIELKKKYPDYTAKGTIYISRNDYAIHKLQYAVYNDRKRNVDPNLRDRGIKGQLVFEVVTEYKRWSNYRMYPNYISFHNTFRLAQPPKFTVEYLKALPIEGTFSLTFNGPLAAGDMAEDEKWYSIDYKDEELKFENIEKINDSTVVFYPSMTRKSLNSMMRELVIMSNKRLDISKVLQFEATGLLDKEGNVLNQWTYKDYNQFREFFVQELKPLKPVPKDTLFMRKDRPIFEDQPISKPRNFEDYWMNTPLRRPKIKMPR